LVVYEELFQNNSKMPVLVSSFIALIELKFSRRMISMIWVEQLPRRIQITFGGKPCKRLNSLKSTSFVTMR